MQSDIRARDWGLPRLDMQEFFDWIDFHLLVDLQMSGANFAWSNHQEHLIMSPLDRFPVSPGLA